MDYNHHHTMELMYAEFRDNYRKKKKENSSNSSNYEQIDIFEKNPQEPNSYNPIIPVYKIRYYLEDEGFSREAGKSAYLSNLVYSKNESNPNGFTKINKLSEYNKDGLVKGNVYEDNENGDIYIVWKGTNPLSIDDILTDVNIFLGSEDITERFREGDLQFQKTKDVYGDRKIYLTGHSMAGGIASRVGAHNKVEKVFTFNRGVVRNSQIIRKDPLLRSKSEQIHFRTHGDVISLGDKVDMNNEKTHNLDSRMGLDPLSQHKMDNFLYIENTQLNKKGKKEMKKDIKNSATTINNIETSIDNLEIVGETLMDIIEGGLSFV